MLRKLAALAAVFVAVLLWSQRERPPEGLNLALPPVAGAVPAPVPASVRQRTFSQSDTGRMVQVSGEVERTLADDRDGSRHQRFIIRLPSGQTLLVSHNIDLAPRLDGLSRGDSLRLYGQYEWNDRGGVVHWTHHDPDGDHPGGYIEWRGRRYE